MLSELANSFVMDNRVGIIKSFQFIAAQHGDKPLSDIWLCDIFSTVNALLINL